MSSLFWFCSFGFGCNSSSVRRWDAKQLDPAAAAARAERPRHSRPAEKFVLVASDINIFGSLPSWQGKLFVRPTRESDWAFSGPGSWAASRRYCGNGDDDDGGDDDGTSCSNSSRRSRERYRSCSVSIQTVVVLSKAASVVAAAAAVLPCPYEWCIPRRTSVVVCRSNAILPARRLRGQSSG